MSNEKIIETSMYGQVYAPESFGELMSLLKTIDYSHGDPHGWRGQANIHWPLHSSAVRRIKNFPEQVKDMSLEEAVCKYPSSVTFRTKKIIKSRLMG